MITVGTTVVSGSPINGGGGAGLPVAAGAGEVPLSTGAGTTYVAANFGDEVSAVLVTALGAEPAGTAIVGDGAGDITNTSADVSAVLAAADAAAARAALGMASVPVAPVALGTAFDAGTSTTAYVDVTGTPSAAPTLAAGQSLVVLFRPVALPAGSEVIACHGNSAGTRGWHLYAGYEAGDRGHLSLYLAGLTGTGSAGTIPMTAATFAGDLNVPHVLAVALLVDGALRYSWDGGAAQTVAAPTGTYAPPISGDPTRVGQFVNATAEATSIQSAALRTYSTVLSNADLAAVCALRASYLIADPSAGTLTTDLSAAQFRGAATAIDRASSQRWRLVGALLVHEQP